MEEEIDLRPYIELVVRKRYWVLMSAIVFSVIAVGISFLLPKTYAATALIAVIDPKDLVQFDQGISNVQNRQPLDAFPELAESDSVLTTVINNIGYENEVSLNEFRQTLTARAGLDESLIRLIATSNEPDIAASVANAWADSFVSWANEVYGTQSEEKVDFFETQLEIANQDLDVAEEDLELFQAINQTTSISNTLNIYLDRQVELLVLEQDIEELKQNANLLRDRIESFDDSQKISYADQLTYLQLQLEVFKITSDAPILLQLDGSTELTSVDKGNFLEDIDSLITILSQKEESILANIEELEPEILQLQQINQATYNEWVQKQRNANIARQTYTSLAFQVNEERIASQDTTSGFRLASRASIPELPLGPRKLVVAGIAGVLGALFGIFYVFASEWWRADSN